MREAANSGMLANRTGTACPFCAERLPASAQFCVKCGQPGAPTPTSASEELHHHLNLARPAESSSATTRQARLATLPLAAPLIGREAALADLLAHLRAGSICGVFGPEGVGKTALAAEAVARLAEGHQAFPGSIAWIPCDGLEGEAGLGELWAHVARSLQLEPVLVQPTPQKRRGVLAAALAEQQRSLLALDNIEPGLNMDAVLETLVIRGHALLLLTARQRIPSQRVVSFDLAPLHPADARTLFLKRLGWADVPLLPQEEDTLPALMDALGRLPLALELTAAYAGMQLPGLERLVHEIRSVGFNAAAGQDSTELLLTCLERSWAALPTRVQQLLASLSLLASASFPQAAALALAEETWDDVETPEGENAFRGDLATLINYALIQVLPGGDRLRLHPLLRAYATRQFKALPAALQARLGNAMAVSWLAYASAHPGPEGIHALEAEAVGLMGAATWAQEHAQYRMVLGLAHALRHAWNARGLYDEEVRLYTWASKAAQKLGDLREQRWATHQLGVIQHRLGQLGEAQASYERALTLAWQVADLAAERDEVYALALLDTQQGHLSAARVGHEQALALARQSGDIAAEWEGIHALALLDSQAGRLAEAREHYEQALILARRLGEPAAEAIELGNFGLFLYRQGEQERGRAFIHESLEMSQRLHHSYDVGKCHQFLAWLASDEGNRAEAITHYREALRCFERVGSPEAKKVRADLRQVQAEIAVERPFKPEVVRVVRALLHDHNSWEETHALLEQEQALLLTNETEQFLGALIDQAQQDGTPVAQDRADYMAAHLFLLRDARASTVSAAWERFRQTLLITEEPEEAPEVSPATSLTHEEAAHAAENASFLAKKFGLPSDDPQLPILQQHLRDFLAEQQETQ
jgi:tetratricopeptide (TPR) repeat protein